MSMVGLERRSGLKTVLHNESQDLNTSRMSAGFADVSQLADEEKEKLDALIERLEEERRRMMGTTELLATGQSPRDSRLSARDEAAKLRAELENIKHHNRDLEQELDGLRTSLNSDQPPRMSTPHDPYRMPQHPHFTHPKSPYSPTSSMHPTKPVQNNILYKRDLSPRLHNGSHSPDYSGNILATSGSQVGNHSPYASNTSLNSSIPTREHSINGYGKPPKGEPPNHHSLSGQPHYERLKGGSSPLLHDKEMPHKFHDSYHHSPRSHPHDVRKNISNPDMGHAVTHLEPQKTRSPYNTNRSLDYPQEPRESTRKPAQRSSHSTPRSTHSTPISSLVPHGRPLSSSEHTPVIIPPLDVYHSTEAPVKPQRSHRSSHASLADSPTPSKHLKREDGSHLDPRNSSYLPTNETSAKFCKSSDTPQRSQSVKSLISQASSDITQTPYDVNDNLRPKAHKRHSSVTVSSDAESFSSAYSQKPGQSLSHLGKNRRQSVSSCSESNGSQKRQLSKKIGPNLSSAGDRNRLNSHHKSESENGAQFQTQSSSSLKGSLVHARHVVSSENLVDSRDTLDTLHGGTSDPNRYDSPGRFDSSQTGSISPIPDTPRSFDPRREYSEEINPYPPNHSTDCDITDHSFHNMNEKSEQDYTSPEEVKVHMTSRSDMPLHSSTLTSVDTLIKAPLPSKTHPKTSRSHSGSDRMGSRRNIENESPNRQDRPSPKARKLKKKKKESRSATDNESLASRTPAEGDIESRFSEKSFRTDESFSSPEEEMKMLVAKMQEIMPSIHDQDGAGGKMSELKIRKPMQEVILAADQTRLAIGRFTEYAIAVAAGEGQ